MNGGNDTNDRQKSSFGVSAVARNFPGQIKVTSGGSTPIPAWVPQYPNSAPSNIVAKEQGRERSVEFSFATGDGAQNVIGWYERKLREAEFTIVSSTVFDSSTAKLTAQDASGRSILALRMEPAGNRKVVALEAREGVQ
ncbi:MAG: hypothetical protein HY695_27175 [Deltaproteobacteria bacterium]|nr:hypothetical protein [Deltaproteobacteria bacterium]